MRNKCLYLHTAYIIALDKLGRGTNTWVNTCCWEAVDLLGHLGFDRISDRKKISYWNIEFFKENHFPCPNPYVANKIKPTPPFFEYFPKAMANSSTFILKHLDHVSAEMLHSEIIT